MAPLTKMLATAAAVAAGALQGEAILVAQGGSDKQKNCATEDSDRRSTIVAKMAVYDVKCEAMCKKLGIYPKCQCPGFEGNPPSGVDMRKCMDQYCQDPNVPCPTDGFVTCVKESTSVSALQWDSLLQRLDISLTLYSRMVQKEKAQKTVATTESCSEKHQDHCALLQAKMAVYDVKCEAMCKKLGIYPKCQCPGFEGNPPSGGDMRKCMDQYCQDPNTPCPTDGFVTCVKDTTVVSALQWDSVFKRLSTSLDLYKSTMVKAQNSSKVHA